MWAFYSLPLKNETGFPNSESFQQTIHLYILIMIIIIIGDLMEKRRSTRQRLVILEELRRMSSHPTADELYAEVRKRLPNISLGTVYRNLDLLCEESAALKLALAGSAKRFDGNTAPHHHVRCTRCGVIADLPTETVHTEPWRGSDASGFEVLDCRVELSGFCPSCRSAGEGGHQSVSCVPGVAGRPVAIE